MNIEDLTVRVTAILAVIARTIGASSPAQPAVLLAGIHVEAACRLVFTVRGATRVRKAILSDIGVAGLAATDAARHLGRGFQTHRTIWAAMELPADETEFGQAAGEILAGAMMAVYYGADPDRHTDQSVLAMAIYGMRPWSPSRPTRPELSTRLELV